MLETERLWLRPPAEADAPIFEAFFGSARGRFIGGGPDLEPGKAWRVFAMIAGHWTLRGCGPFILVDKADGAPIGAVGPWFPPPWPERELSWSIWSAPAEGRGFAGEAARRLRAHVFDDLGWETAVSYVDPANARSAALAERLGCVRDPDAATPFDEPTLVFRHRRA